MNISAAFWFFCIYLLVCVRLIKQYLLVIALICTLTITVIASIVTNTTYQQIKRGILEKSISSVASIEYLIRIGDQYNTQRMFNSTKNTFDQSTQQKLQSLAFPKQSLLLALQFWESVHAVQPTSREAVLALAVLNMQLKKQSVAKPWFEELKYIEPNDGRLKELEKFF